MYFLIDLLIFYICIYFDFERRNAFRITETELNPMAMLAILGFKRRPKTGYKAPAAIGTASPL